MEACGGEFGAECVELGADVEVEVAVEVCLEVCLGDSVFGAGVDDGFDGPAVDGVGGVVLQPLARAGLKECSEGCGSGKLYSVPRLNCHLRIGDTEWVQKRIKGQ